MTLEPQGYVPRVVDGQIRADLAISPAVVIDGAKRCGKTFTGLRHSRSSITLDSMAARQAAEHDLASLLEGDVPRLLDEWVAVPGLWNEMRHECDRRGRSGQFLLAGSVNPADYATRHSGAGRITRVRMRPMSLYEQGLSTGRVSLAGLMAGEPVEGAYAEPERYGRLLEWMCRGGWPGHTRLGTGDVLRLNKSYVAEMCRLDVPAAAGVGHSPRLVERLMRSLARSPASEISLAALARDIGGANKPANYRTVDSMAGALTDVFATEDLPAWHTDLRSRARLRSAEKRHFVDPSLAVAALRTTPDRLSEQPALAGQLFETMALRDLRVYAQRYDDRIFHYRDNAGLEVDVIIECDPIGWVAVEVKLGSLEPAVSSAVRSLLRLRDKVDASAAGEPVKLVVLTGSGSAYEMASGISVVPLTMLGP